MYLKYTVHSTVLVAKSGHQCPDRLGYHIATSGILLNGNIWLKKKKEEKIDFKTNKEANGVKLRCFLYIFFSQIWNLSCGLKLLLPTSSTSI